MGDLTKLVGQYQGCHDPTLKGVLFALAEQIEGNNNLILDLHIQIKANEKEIEKLKESSENPYLLTEEEIQRMRQRM